GLQIIKGLMAEGSFSFSGKHYQIKDLERTPKPAQKTHPPILLGGGGRKMLGIAGREADIVNINYNLQEGRINRKMVRSGMASATEEKLGWIKEAAGDRFEALELSVTVFVATVTDDRDSIAEAMGSGLDMER